MREIATISKLSLRITYGKQASRAGELFAEMERSATRGGGDRKSAAAKDQSSNNGTNDRSEYAESLAKTGVPSAARVNCSRRWNGRHQARKRKQAGVEVMRRLAPSHHWTVLQPPPTPHPSPRPACRSRLRIGGSNWRRRSAWHPPMTDTDHAAQRWRIAALPVPGATQAGPNQNRQESAPDSLRECPHPPGHHSGACARFRDLAHYGGAVGWLIPPRDTVRNLDGQSRLLGMGHKTIAAEPPSGCAGVQRSGKAAQASSDYARRPVTFTNCAGRSTAKSMRENPKNAT